MSSNRKGQVAVTRDLSTRVDLVEEGLRSITGTLVDMRAEMKAERKEIAVAFESLRIDLGSRARPFPFKEVAASIIATSTIMGSVITAANWWYDARSAVLTRDVTALSLAAAPEELAVLKYRLKLLEAAVKIPMASQ